MIKIGCKFIKIVFDINQVQAGSRSGNHSVTVLASRFCGAWAQLHKNRRNPFPITFELNIKKTGSCLLHADDTQIVILDASSETQGQSVGPGEKARRKFSVFSTTGGSA